MTQFPSVQTNDDAPPDAVSLRVVFGSHRVVDDETLDLAVFLVEAMNILRTLLAWKAAERRGPGGRPVTFSFRALLVALVACALTDQPLELTQVCDVMFRQMSPHWQEVLGIPDAPAEDDQKGWKSAYRNVRTRFHDLESLLDPSPSPKNRRLDHETFVARTEEIRAQRTEAEWNERDERLSWVLNRILEASMRLLPRRVRRAWKGTVGVDATLVRSFARAEGRTDSGRGKRGAREVEVHSADPDAGYYVRETDSRDDVQSRRWRGKPIWGREATLVVSAPDDPNDPNFPSLVVGMAPLHKPSQAAGANGIRALRSVIERGHPAGYLAADRAYSSASMEDFQLPAVALGYKPVYDYRSDQLGVKDNFQGFLLIEGAYYCPSIPETLKTATADYRNHKIDEATYRVRLKERWKHLARPKGSPDPEGHVRLQCPAAGSWPQARCELKPSSIRKETAGRIHIMVRSDVQSSPPLSCTQQSVTLPPEAGAKYRQEFLFGSEPWHQMYSSVRSANEGMNGYIKDPAHEALDDAGRRRLFGTAAQSILTALLLMAANVRKIQSFIANSAASPGSPTRRPRRRRTRSVGTWRPKAPANSTIGPDPPLVS